MPAAVVRTKDGEDAWRRAKSAVSKQYGGEIAKGSDRYYQLVMHVYKSICASPKHDCKPTIKTHPSSRKRVESMKTSEMLTKLEESLGADGAQELQEMDGMNQYQNDLYHEVMSTVGYGDVRNPEAAVKAATKRIYDVKMANCRHDLDIAGKCAVAKLKKRAEERAAREK